jgi:hypothetical protein
MDAGEILEQRERAKRAAREAEQLRRQEEERLRQEREVSSRAPAARAAPGATCHVLCAHIRPAF